MHSIEQGHVSVQHQVTVLSESERLPWLDLLPILERLLPVKFSLANRARARGVGEIIPEAVAEAEQGGRIPSVSSLRVPQHESSARDGKLIDIQVRFADDLEVPFPFRGRCLRAKIAVQPRQLSLRNDEKALAVSDGRPVWSSFSRMGVKHFRSAFALPSVPPDSALHDVLNAERFLELLPLLHWVRELCAGTRYEGPPLRACFMFDDPNLHWPSYGHVDFRQIAEHAAKENYHVSFATIPLDGWFVHCESAHIFRSHPRRLSLLIHGNDHARRELARDYSHAERVSLLQQAVRRIERLEAKAGLRVCRVMVPPHGACSDEMLADLPRCGFEAGCISHGSLRAHNKTKSWTRELGYSASELIQGCPVLPRWGLSGNTSNTILLAAFLEQPIVLRGHQEDLRDGVDLLDQLARFVNSLGSVCWSNLTGLSRMNYLWRMDGSTLRLRPLGRKLTVHLPGGAETLVMQNPSHFDFGSWQIFREGGAPVEVRPSEIMSLGGMTNGAISVEPLTPLAVSAGNPSKLPPVTALFRRLITEGRDRFLS